MKTDDLIGLMSRDDAPPKDLLPRLGATLALSLAACLVVTGMMLGFRSDLAAAVVQPATAMKWLLPLVAAGLGLAAALRLAHPLTDRWPALLRIFLLAGVVGLWWTISAVATPADALWPQIKGSSLAVCLASVLAIAILPLGLGLRQMAHGATVHPTRSGAALGLGVGGMAAAIYALHCNEDRPLFFLTWYGLAILIVTALGALAGNRYLRW